MSGVKPDAAVTSISPKPPDSIDKNSNFTSENVVAGRPAPRLVSLLCGELLF